MLPGRAVHVRRGRARGRRDHDPGRVHEGPPAGVVVDAERQGARRGGQGRDSIQS